MKDIVFKDFTSPKGDKLRTVLYDGKLWFSSRDIANLLGMDRSSDMMNRLDPEDVFEFTVTENKRISFLLTFSLRGLLLNLTRSVKPQAAEVKEWIMNTVVPELHKEQQRLGFIKPVQNPVQARNEQPKQSVPEIFAPTPAPIPAPAPVPAPAPEPTLPPMPNGVPKSFSEALALAANLQAQIEFLEKKLQQVTLSADATPTTSTDAFDLGTVAKSLGIKGLSKNALFFLMRRKRVFDKDNLPYQQYLDLGYFRVEKNVWRDAAGVPHDYFKTLVCSSGLPFIRELVAKEMNETKEGESE
jgi:prophage antirepressor-like protein/phage antirepressor YoqD-like protein